MNTLLINAQPDFQNDAHYSVRLMNHFIELFRESFPDDALSVLNLAEEWIPRATCDELLGVWTKQASGAQLTSAEEKVDRRNAELLSQFMDSHRIVIATPLHNFNVPSQLKDYMDNILRARKTFRYVSGGSVGLMTDDRRALLLQASGAVYTNNDRFTPLEFSRMYLDAMFTNIMGFDSFQIVRAQGTSSSKWDDAHDLPLAFEELDRQFAKFYAE